MKNLGAISLFLILIGCGPQVENVKYQNLQRDYQNLDEEELIKIAPNNVFMSILEEDFASLKTFIEKDPSHLNQVNEKTGDRPLGLAIKLQNKKMAAYVLSHTYKDDLLFQNKLGEGYLFLLSKFNMPELIDSLVAAYQKSLSLFEDYEFAHLDMVTNKGERAIHVAANSEVAEVLARHWYHGWLEFPYSNFLRHQDLEGNNFLHSAARDGRVEIIQWGVKRFCSKTSWEKSDSGFKQFVGKLFRVSKQSVQMVIPDGADYWLHFKNLINWRNDAGETSLLVAVNHKNLSSVKALSHCDWLDYTIKNNQGQNALNLLISKVDPTLHQSEKERALLDFLLSQNTKVKSFYYFPDEWINEADDQGQSSLHKSAVLSDTYFYDQLKQGGNIYLEDNAGRTPYSLKTRAK